MRREDRRPLRLLASESLGADVVEDVVELSAPRGNPEALELSFPGALGTEEWRADHTRSLRCVYIQFTVAAVTQAPGHAHVSVR